MRFESPPRAPALPAGGSRRALPGANGAIPRRAFFGRGGTPRKASPEPRRRFLIPYLNPRGRWAKRSGAAFPRPPSSGGARSRAARPEVTLRRGAPAAGCPSGGPFPASGFHGRDRCRVGPTEPSVRAAAALCGKRFPGCNLHWP